MGGWISRLEYRLQAEKTILTRVNAVLQTALSAPVAHMRLPAFRAPFVQQLKRQNTPRAKNSLFLWEQGVAPFSGAVCAQNSGTIRATRPIDRGTPSDL
jgi:hypothetical protein